MTLWRRDEQTIRKSKAKGKYAGPEHGELSYLVEKPTQ